MESNQMTKSIWRKWWAFFLVGIAFLTSCGDHDDTPSTEKKQFVYKVAVLANAQEMEHWKRTGDWALSNIEKAQDIFPFEVKLQLEFKNQDDADIDDYMQSIAEDTSVVAVIGPTSSASAEKMVRKIASSPKYHKPVITPAATDIEFQRKFAAADFLWNLSESDITQLEVLLSRVINVDHYGTDKVPVYLLTQDEEKTSGAGNSFSDWFGFIAEEYGLDVKGIYLYKNEEDVRRCARELSGYKSDLEDNVLVFNPSTPEMALAFDDELGKVAAATPGGRHFCAPQVFCSDNFVNQEIASTVKNATYRGIDLWADPASGFQQAYQRHFGENLINGEAQYYDAICLVVYGIFRASYSENDLSLNDAIREVIAGRDTEEGGSGWLPMNMASTFVALALGECPDLQGAASSFTYDENTHSSVLGSTYRYWQLYNKQFVTKEYVSTEGSKRADSSKDKWNWSASKMQEFNPEMQDITYPEHKDNWALLVAGSNTWKNYRFQADVFSIYKYLLSQGFDKEHIVLVAEDDIANNPSNPEPGTLRVREDGVNVYVPSAVDYKLSDLQPTDIADILEGKESERLPKVIHATENDNVFVFWSSHGEPGKFDFGTNRQNITHEQIRDGIKNAKYRKMMIVVEACYSGGFGQVCNGLPGVLVMTAASPYETSHADQWSDKTRTYLSNSFTTSFLKAITDQPSIMLRDLYYRMALGTHGSHVNLYNGRNYGNVYNNRMNEFFDK